MYVLILMEFTANDCRPVEHNWRLNNNPKRQEFADTLLDRR